MTQEEKAHNYDEAIKRANSLLSDNQLGNAWIYKLLPELKESKGERIKEVILKALMADEAINILVESGIYYEDVESWLEKQCEHANFRNAIQIGDKVTRNQDGMLVNLSQLNRVAKKQGEQKPADLPKGEDYGIDGLYAAIDILQKTLGKVDGYQTDDGILEHECAISVVKNLYEQKPADWLQELEYKLANATSEQLAEWKEKYFKDEQKPIDKIQLGKKYKCIASPRYTAFIKGSIYKPEDRFLCSLMNFCSDCFEPIEDGEQKPADKVEPKFKIGDWVVHDMSDGKKIIRQIVNMTNKSYILDGECFNTFYFNDLENDYHLWTIADAKDGDVLSYGKGQWVFVFKEIKNNNSIIEYYALLSERGLEIKDAASTSLISAILPATKEQRDLLFQKMKEAGYEWDTKKKELKKIKQKHFCELNNLCACIKFPFKAKVKSSGKIVTIHDGQLSYDGKEWIKYQSDAQDGYKVYEPNNLLELVCEIEQNPSWSEEDEKMLKFLKTLLNSASCYSCTEGVDKILSWLKSLKERYTWKPSDEQMKALADALSLAKNCGEEIAFDLRTLHEQLKKLR